MIGYALSINADPTSVLMLTFKRFRNAWYVAKSKPLNTLNTRKNQREVGDFILVYLGILWFCNYLFLVVVVVCSCRAEFSPSFLPLQLSATATTTTTTTSCREISLRLRSGKAQRPDRRRRAPPRRRNQIPQTPANHDRGEGIGRKDIYQVFGKVDI